MVKVTWLKVGRVRIPALSDPRVLAFLCLTRMVPQAGEILTLSRKSFMSLCPVSWLVARQTPRMILYLLSFIEQTLVKLELPT